MSTVRVGPVGTASRHLFDIAEIGESRHPMSLGAFEIGGDQAALPITVQQRHPVRVVQRAQEIMDQAGDEDGLAGSAEPGHRQPDRRRARKFSLNIADRRPDAWATTGGNQLRFSMGVIISSPTGVIAPETELYGTLRKCGMLL